MKRFLKNFIFYLFSAIIIYCILVGVSFMLVPSAYLKNIKFVKGNPSGFLNTRLKEAEYLNRTDEIDILVVGSSHAYRGYDPRIFKKSGQRLFNFGSSSQTPIQTELLVKRYVKRLNPDLIVLDIYPVLFSGNGLESTLDFIANANYSLDIFYLGIKQLDFNALNSLIARSFDELFITDSFQEKLKNGTDSYIQGGYVENRTHFSEQKEITRSNLSLSSKQKEAFENIIEYLRVSNINFVLIQSPMLERKYDSYNSEKIDSYIKSRDVKYFNFNEILDLNDDSFIDPSHLNQHGVEAFNKNLLKLLENNNLINLNG